MTLYAVVDNDVIIKLACYSMLDTFASHHDGGRSLGALAVARFVVTKAIHRQAGITDAHAALSSANDFFQVVNLLEPTDNELDIATQIEEAASIRSIQLDIGESQLCAMILARSIQFLVTGDKRAVEGVEVLVPTLPSLASLGGRIVCLEQLMRWLLSVLGSTVVGSRICGEPEADKALRLCCRCTSSASVSDHDIATGLDSYIQDLRRRAPTVLAASAAYVSP